MGRPVVENQMEDFHTRTQSAVKERQQEGRQVILLGSQVKRMEKAGMLSKDRDGCAYDTPAPKVSE